MGNTWITSADHCILPAKGRKDLPLALRRRSDLTAKLVIAAARVSQGFLFRSSISCIRRPERKPCPGVIHFRRFDEPQEEIKWFCLRCDDNGSISEWKKTIDDFRSIHANANIHLEPLSELFVADAEFQLLAKLHPPIESAHRYRIEKGHMLLGTIAEMEPLLGGVAHARTQATDPEEKKNLLELFERLEEDLWISKDLAEELGNNAHPN